MIGNSLTNDGRHDLDGIRGADMGVALRRDYYINGNYSLRLIVDDPTSIEFSAGVWSTALPAIARNFFAFEPWPTTQNTIGTEFDAWETLRASALSSPSVAPKFFHYQTWPSSVQYGSNFSTYWAQAVVDSDSTFFSGRKQCHDYFFNRAKAAYASTYLIPCGDVLAEFDRLARLGLVPDGITDVNNMYRDAQHMSDAGRFLASSTKLAVMLRRPPSSKNTRGLFREGNAGQPLTDALADFIETLVWQIVYADSRTGVQ